MMRRQSADDSATHRRLNRDDSLRSATILDIVSVIVSDGNAFYVLSDTPEQFEDVFRILVDDRYVVGFELPRGDHTHPISVQIYTINEYRDAISPEGRAELAAMLEIAKADAQH